MKKYRSVWYAIETTGAMNMKVRASLMIATQKRTAELQGSQTEKAKRLGINQSRLNDLQRGRVDKFSLDALVNIATRAGLKVSLHLRKAA